MKGKETLEMGLTVKKKGTAGSWSQKTQFFTKNLGNDKQLHFVVKTERQYSDKSIGIYEFQKFCDKHLLI